MNFDIKSELDERKYYRAKEVQSILGCCRSEIDSLVNDGFLTKYRITKNGKKGKIIYFSRSEVDTLIQPEFKVV